MHRFVPAALAATIAAALTDGRRRSGGAARATTTPSRRSPLTCPAWRRPRMRTCKTPGASRAARRARGGSRTTARRRRPSNGLGHAVDDRRAERPGRSRRPDRRGVLRDPGPVPGGTTATRPHSAASNFIFDSEDGTISAWRIGSTAALVTVDMSSAGAVFKGLAISNGSSGPRLYATDFAQRSASTCSTAAGAR